MSVSLLCVHISSAEWKRLCTPQTTLLSLSFTGTVEGWQCSNNTVGKIRFEMRPWHCVILCTGTYSEQIGFCLFQKTILIGDAVSDEIVGELCNACSGLHNALAERGMLGRQCKKRSAILRTLFRLIDVGSDRLNLTIAKLILAVSISTNTHSTVCLKPWINLKIWVWSLWSGSNLF